jgi:hypothetical protein
MRLPLLLAIVMVSCSKPPAARLAPAAAAVVPASAAASPPIPGLPSSLTVKQRSQTSIPGSDLVLTIDDITRGQVQASIRADKDVLVQPAYLKPAEKRRFDYQKRNYELTLVELNNALVGEDFATFQLSEASPAPAAAVLSEQEKIDRMIAKVESLQGATFVRNGAEHTPAEAAKHLHDKRKSAGDKLTTADQFIEQVASKSSLSGEEYVIRFADGRSVKAGEFLKQELKEMTPAPGPRTP